MSERGAFGQTRPADEKRWNLLLVWQAPASERTNVTIRRKPITTNLFNS